MLFFEMAVSVVHAVKMLATQAAPEKLSCAVNGLVVSTKVLFEGETPRIMTGRNFALERSLVSAEVLAIIRASIALYLIRGNILEISAPWEYLVNMHKGTSLLTCHTAAFALVPIDRWGDLLGVLFLDRTELGA
jgi:hypothetical protein